VFRIRHIRLAKFQTVAGIRREPTLIFSMSWKTTEHSQTTEWFNKLFLAWQPSSTERTTENLVS